MRIPYGIARVLRELLCPCLPWACLLLLIVFSPVSALAQSESAGPSTEQAGSGSKPAANDILNMDIEQLANVPVVVPSMDIPVTSVTKELSTVGRSAAAIFVITNEMIRRSGVTNVPDALRMAPGVEVLQINANTWSITIRGFAFGQYSNKLLVLIDGRTIYNPDFAGVYWNAQDVLLEDVDRIEVVRGPGGTLWGANAVNGVINIISKEAKNTQGAYAMAGGGSQLRDTEAFRYGGTIGDDVQYRIYGKHFEQGANPYVFDTTGPANDAWRQGRAGFRADWQPDRDKSNTFTIQGDHFVGSTNNSTIPTATTLSDYMTGENLLARWRHVYDEDSDWTLQTYYDNYMRRDSLQTQIDKTLDVDFQYRFPLGNRHSVTCGAGFRNVESRFTGGDRFTAWFPQPPAVPNVLAPAVPNWTTNFPSQFVQDEISLVDDRLVFTVGCKLEENPYTGMEYQPSARLLWAPDKRHSFWGAISRAVHTPTRAEEQISFNTTHYYPTFYQRAEGTNQVNGSLTSEAVVAYELGYRAQTTDKFSWDIATFYNVYDSVIAPNQLGRAFVETSPAPPHVVVPTIYHNNDLSSITTYGIELFSKYEVSKRWRLHGQYTLFHMNQIPLPQSLGFFNDWDPCNMLYLSSSWDVRENLDFDVIVRYVDRISFGGDTAAATPSYVTMDMRLAWRPRTHLELALVGQNLLQQQHKEIDPLGLAYGTDVPRSAYGTVTWRH